MVLKMHALMNTAHFHSTLTTTPTLLTHQSGCAGDRWGHLSCDRRSCTGDTWRASLLSGAWCGAAGFLSGWKKRHTGYTGTDVLLRTRNTTQHAVRALTQVQLPLIYSINTLNVIGRLQMSVWIFFTNKHTFCNLTNTQLEYRHL